MKSRNKFFLRTVSDMDRVVKAALSVVETKRGAPLVLALSGDLGSGKTEFARRFLRALGAGGVSSPTFVLMREHELRHPFYKKAYHVDVYRLDRPEEILRLGLDRIMRLKGSVTIIEWADRISKHMPAGVVKIRFRHGRRQGERSAIILKLP